MKQTLVAAIAFLLLDISFPLHAEDIQVSDISDGKVTLIGRLGKPLGTVVTLEGQLVSDPKAGTAHFTAAFRAIKVDGMALKKAQIISIEFLASQGASALRANQLVKCSGYEAAVYVGTPDAAREALGADASALDWKLASMVHVIKLL